VFPVIAGIYGTNALCIHFALFDAARLETVNDAIRVAFAVTLAVFVIALARAIGGARRQRDGAA
jgi:hypothetical protein